MDCQGTLFLFRFDLKLLATVQTDFSDACDIRKPSSDRFTTALEGVVPCIRFASCSSEAVCFIGSTVSPLTSQFHSVRFYLHHYIYIYIETVSNRTGRSTFASQFSFHLQSCFSSNAFWHARAKRHQGQPAGRRRLPHFITFCIADAWGGSLLMNTGIQTCSRSSFIFVN